jgi:glycosyltransferase involved in cell wall biosynthesis
MKKVAIVYDRVNKWGGAERVLLALHDIFPDAHLYTSVYDKKGAPWAKAFPKVHTSFLQKVPLARKYHELLATLMPLAFKSFDLSGHDIVISVTSESAKGVRVSKKTLHICYCLTPTRYLWSHHDIYFKNPTLRFFSRPAVKYLRKWDKKAAKNPNVIVGISTEVKDRIKKYYKREAEIIFPPVEIKKSSGRNKPNKGNYYLLVGRLDFGYKKVELAIEAFNKLKKPLVIVGEGRGKKKLMGMSGKNIKFAGFVPDKKLAGYYKGAKALIMPQEEDFGIVAVEAQMHGVPVIAFKKGGATDTVIPGKTGIFFNEQKPDSLISAVKRFEKKTFDKKEILLNAQRFSKARFKKELLALINKSYTRI